MASNTPYGPPPHRSYSPAPLATVHLAASGSSPSSPSAASPSSSKGPASPIDAPGLSRPSALSVRRETPNQTRMRARSLNSGKGAAAPVVLPHLSPTFPGSPVQPSMSAFLDPPRGHGHTAPHAGGSAPSPLARQRAEYDRRKATASDGSDADEPFASAEGTEESGSTQSDSPPHTPREYHDVPSYWVEPPSRRGSDVEWIERENWRTGGEAEEEAERLARELAEKEKVQARHRSKSLEGQTRLSLRRGRSFTSLLVQPVTPSPAVERKDPFAHGSAPPPILEQAEPPPTPSNHSDIESGEEHRPSASLYSPATGAPGAAAAPLAPRTLRDFVPQLVILLSLFVSSFAVVAVTIATLPGLFIPHSMADLPALTKTLTSYRASAFSAELHLFAVLSLLFLWKQCFSIPGSILTNILFGALYGTTLGTWWACLWTAAGSTGAYGIALVIAPLVEYYFAKPLDMTRRALKLPVPGSTPPPVGVAQPAVAPLSSSDLFSHLLLARFFPLLPYSVLNVISGVLRLPLAPFFITLLVGSFPFNFATVSIGNLVALAAADPSVPLGDKIWSREVVLKLVAVTLVSVLPLVFKNQLRRLLSSSTTSGGIAFALERARSLVSRALFGFGSVPSSSVGAVSSAPTHQASLSAGSPRAWRRKLSRSLGGAGEFLLHAFHAAPSGAGGYGYERVDARGGEGATGVLDEAEMGGIA
ncbi:TVP38/TMEM64 family protein [Rhodotorula paludigena]|uniref:TVP38/TMEM64 family protein n=1 Tax=Rhodotorula paludigena TaxID=86838 RepID=UPI00316BD26F